MPLVQPTPTPPLDLVAQPLHTHHRTLLAMNQALVDLITQALPRGLYHPGDEHTPSRVLPTPFAAVGMSDEQAAELIGQSAKLWAEAITHLVESQFELLTKADAQQLRQDAADAPDGTRIVTLHCGSTNAPALLTLTVGKTDQVAIPAAALNALKDTL